MAESTVTTYFLGDSRDLERSLSRLRGDAGKTAKSGSKMGAAFKKYGKMAAAGAAVAAAGVAAFGVSALKAAGEDEAAQRKLAQTLKKTTGARKSDIAGIEAWIDKTSRASGVMDDELRPALSKLLIGGRNQKQAMKDLSLAMDISAASGKDLNTVTGAMQKAARGNTGALGKLGIATKDASGKALSYKDILKEASKEMGGAAKSAAGGFEGGMKRLNVAFNEAKETIGAKLLPVATKLINWFLDKGAPAIGRFWGALKARLLPILKKIWPILVDIGKKALEGVRAGMESVREAIERNRPQLEQLWEGMKKVAEYIVTELAPKIGPYLKKYFKIAGKAIGFVIDAIGFLLDAAPTVINSFIRPVVGAFLTFAEMIVTAADTAFGWIPGLGDKLHKAKEAVQKFRVQVDDQLAILAAKASNRGESIGANVAKGIARGLRKNSHLPKAEAARMADRVARQSGASGGVNVPAYASGTTSAKRGMAVVGEDGPELVYMRGGETVVPNGGRARGRRSGGEQTVHIVIEGTGVLAGLRREIRVKGGDVQAVLGPA